MHLSLHEQTIIISAIYIIILGEKFTEKRVTIITKVPDAE